MNDEERLQWCNNHEPLYTDMQSYLSIDSRRTEMGYVRKYRKWITRIIRRELDRKPVS